MARRLIRLGDDFADPPSYRFDDGMVSVLMRPTAPACASQTADISNLRIMVIRNILSARPLSLLNPEETIMADMRDARSGVNPPTDPDRPLSGVRAAANDPHRPAAPLDQELREPVQLDNELQADPELAEGPASGRRIAVFAMALVVIIGTVFYVMNTPSNPPAGATSTAQSQPQPPASNTNVTPGTTTGAAPASPPPPGMAKPAPGK